MLCWSCCGYNLTQFAWGFLTAVYWYSMPISYKIVQRLTYLLLAINSLFGFNSLPCQWFRLVEMLFYGIESLLRGCTGKLRWCDWSTLLSVHLSGIFQENQHLLNRFETWRLQSWGTFLWILWLQMHTKCLWFLSLNCMNSLSSSFTFMMFIGKCELWRYFWVACTPVSSL